ncbi:hypothetical protein C8R45DRAFT_1204318 [Mycena sanguinolenta]|nr:hypothetical protein C8R45DRAFT_1204318 [Mycena sanguinolenta]
MAASRPAKRKRTETAPITRSRWLPDGNVVFQAENVQFRVHWSVLALNSPVFRDMQELPQPAKQPTVDGCPVLKLPDDATDIEYVLNALYDPKFLSQKALSFPAVGALIRLGRKYEFNDLLNLTTARVRAEHPTTIEEYDVLPKKNKMQTIVYQPGLSLAILALASENNILSALPFAHYYVAMKGLDELLRVLKKIKTVDALPSLLLRKCIAGQQKLLIKQFQPGYTLGWVLEAVTPYGCTSPTHCRRAREIFMRQCLDGARIWAFVRGSLVTAECKLCTVCSLHAQKFTEDGRKKLWADLPQMFDLAPWDELTKDI